MTQQDTPSEAITSEVIGSATYSPDDNKIRLYPAARLSPELYARVKAAGFTWAPRQELFVAPMWTPQRADLMIELCGEIGDEDTALVDRAEERAERFEEYSEKRARDAQRARDQVDSIADGIPMGQPILIGHHSERHARRDAAKIESGMRRAISMWETSQYWVRRAEGAISHAKYKERPDVRARRIKGIEADLRKAERSDKESAAGLRMMDLIDRPEKWKANEAGEVPTREERAARIFGGMHANVNHKSEHGHYWTAYDVLRLPVENRYQGVPVMTIDEVIADVRASFERATAYRLRWVEHYRNRLAYERAMLAEGGGTVADKTKPEKGGGCKCWAGPRGGWAYIQKVNKVSVTVLDNWGNGGGNFTRTIPFDKLKGVMTAAEVQQARGEGRIKESEDGTGFYLMQSREEFDADEAKADQDETPKEKSAEQEQAELFAGMKETLRAGVSVVVAPQLFPTPPEIAARMVELADPQPGQRVLEPSAGTGNILRELVKREVTEHPGADPCEVVAVEINGDLVMQLGISGLAETVQQADFLTCNEELGTFDRIVMNPPFENGIDITHIRHAIKFLAPGGRLVALCAAGSRQAAAFSQTADLWEVLPAGSFKASGTGVNVALLVIEQKEIAS